MINEKEIERAANEYNPNVDMFARNERAAFKDGVDWFKKTLWHDVSVKPEGNAVILYQCLDDRDAMDVGIDGVFSDVEWAKFVAYNRITKWCYIEDLLPNK